MQTARLATNAMVFSRLSNIHLEKTHVFEDFRQYGEAIDGLRVSYRDIFFGKCPLITQAIAFSAVLEKPPNPKGLTQVTI